LEINNSMIDIKTEYIYNIILSIFLGIIIALFINQLFITPQIIKVDNESIV
jgi:uncharacterized membrane protein YgaE (UPF0421/DUF939 family)